jgi:hypothetical protein
MATACWDFIVVKTAQPQPAPMLDFSSLRAANSHFHPQIIHNSLWTFWGQFGCVRELLPEGLADASLI